MTHLTNLEDATGAVHRAADQPVSPSAALAGEGNQIRMLSAEATGLSQRLSPLPRYRSVRAATRFVIYFSGQADTFAGRPEAILITQVQETGSIL
jgi:hypothetical protein